MSTNEQALRLVTFGVGDVWYAAEIAYVERVLRHEGVHAIPGMPSWVEGVIAYQGRVVPVIDLHRRFGMVEEARSDNARLLVLASGGDAIAVTVDRVVDVRTVAPGGLAPPPRLVRGASAEFLRGMVRQDDAMVLVLDPRHLLSDEEQASLHEQCDAPEGIVAVGRPHDG